MMNRLVYSLVAILAAILLARSILFVVDQRKYAVVFALGEFKEVVDRPGPHAKLPWPFQRVVFVEKRNQMLETPGTERFRAAGNREILASAFLKWKIRDPKLYFVSFKGNQAAAESRLTQLLNAALSDEIARHAVGEIVAGKRGDIMDAVGKKVADDAGRVGIETIDVRLVRVGYIDEVLGSVYERMKAERVRVANELRASGAAESEKIRSDADRQRTVILAEASREAERIRGEGDAKAAQIYAQAYSRDPEFYRFYRSLEAYRASFGKGDVLVVDPNSEFFRYFKGAGAAGGRK